VPSLGAEVTLAERLKLGPLSLAFALQSATDVAIALRKLHAEGRAHGAIDAQTILLRESSARLGPGSPDTVVSLHFDVMAFGAVLYQLVNGCEPPLDFTDLRPARAAGLAAAATDLAYRCMASRPESAPNMPRVLVEVRLLTVLARQRRTPEPVPTAIQPAHAVTQPLVLADPALEVKPGNQHCPVCGSAYVQKSKPRTWLETKFERFGIPLYRCHRCYHRYCIVLGHKFTKEAILE
jgi:hypothetical protein